MTTPTLHQVNLKRQKEIFAAIEVIAQLKAKGANKDLIKNIASSTNDTIELILKDFNMINHPNHDPRIDKVKLLTADDKVKAILRS